MDLFDCFDRVVIINLPERKDRRRQMEQQLEFAGMSRDRVEFFPGIRPSELRDWPSLGAQGNFLSHYTVLRQACDAGAGSIAILEDDCDFEPCFARVQGQLADDLARADWGVVQFGHRHSSSAGTLTGLRPSAVQVAVHFYAVHVCVLRALVDFLELVISRSAGHPLGGPQFYDGALQTFREQNPAIPVLFAYPSLGRQRRSRSDVTPHWFDRVPYLRSVINELRPLLR